MTKNQVQQLAPLYGVIFLGYLGYALTLTLFIPLIMKTTIFHLGNGDSTSLKASLSGLLLAMYPLGQFLGSPIIGNFSDHFGRKKVLLLSLGACAVGFLGMAASIHFHQLLLLFIFSFLTGLCESNMAIAQSVIADLFEDTAQKTRFIGYAYSACSLGYVLGPLLGGFAGTFLGYPAPFWIAAVGTLCIAAWVLIGFMDQYQPNRQVVIQWFKSLTAIRSVFVDKKLLKIYAINFMIFYAVMGLYRVVPLYVVDEWKPPLHVYSLLISFVSLVCLIVNLVVLAPIAKRY